MQVVVSQKGAREHFLAARALHRCGALAQLVVDWYAPSSILLRVFASLCFGRTGKSASAAWTDEIPKEFIRPLRLLGLRCRCQERSAVRNGRSYEGYVRTDELFASSVARLDLPPHNVFFGYSYASLEILEVERSRGVFTILGQIDPGAVEFRVVADEMACFPELAGAPASFPSTYYERNGREWKLADLIIVNSEWSREAIITEGADESKIKVLPLAFETRAETLKYETSAYRTPISDLRPLKVLWLGQVNVRKGIHYLMEAAKLLEGASVHFDVVGTIGILPGALASAPRNMTFHGSVSRDHATEWYRKNDLFVLPTLSDGFAITQLEALAHGLPLITTPNCGRVVENGRTGFVVPPRDPKSLAEAITRFVRNRDLIHQMRPHCLEAVNAYSIKAYGEGLKRLIEEHRSKSIS